MTSRRALLGSLGAAAAGLTAGCGRLRRLAGGPSELARNEVSSTAGGDGSVPMHQRDAGHTGYVSGTATDESGADRWVSTVDPPNISSGVVVSDESVFVPSADGVHALDRADGSYRWDRRPDATFPTGPVVSDGVVVVGELFDEPVEDEVGAVAYDAADGTELWETTDVPGGWSRPTVRDGTVYLSGGPVDPGVTAVDLAAGGVEWETRLAAETGRVAVDDGGVYVTQATGIRKLDGGGSALWQRPTPEKPRGPPTVADGTVYAQTGPRTFAALDAATGEPRWETSAPAETAFSAAVADGTVYCSGADLVARRTADGRERWRRSPTEAGASVETATDHYGDRGFGELAVTDDTIYLGHGDGLLAVARADGTPRWRRPFRNRVKGGDMVFGGSPGTPAVAGDTVFTFTSGGDCYAVAR
ncbi:PQQ-binding-like beta-propeller repeat protein [Halosimplex pelagicum]|uniref:PQQ-binding-like beta-propeller repeat protein n=1 Tax=Halosimplex pelagicum TaxID=869886 RepID=A0A7D5TWF3_9EURY|nr:PQQ-binding-like beta-propeller repeat protein [Halosimplex pelagicum]QLH84792.1 PQQ-binding-like beta-propeller repeat protein [Halosimplex pelagicum]